MRGSPWLQGCRTVLCLAVGRGHRCARVPAHRGVPSTTAEGPPGLPESRWDPPRACSPAAAPPIAQPLPPPPAALWPLLLFTAAHQERHLSHRLSSPPAVANPPPAAPPVTPQHVPKETTNGLHMQPSGCLCVHVTWPLVALIQLDHLSSRKHLPYMLSRAIASLLPQSPRWLCLSPLTS